MKHCTTVPVNVPITIRVGAYIIRQSYPGGYQLLVFAHPDCPEAPIQLPGGGVEPGESLEAALHREILEESGLVGLTVIRKLGIAEICWCYPRNLISLRHFYLLEAPADIPNRWEHVVQGDGLDSGMQFSYFWQRLSPEFSLPYDQNDFLSREHIPELYDFSPDASMARV